MKKIFTILISLLASIFIVVFLPQFIYGNENTESNEITSETSLVAQNITGVSSVSHPISKIYYRGELIGVLNDRTKLASFLNTIYKTHYQKDFPDSSVELDKDIYITTEESFFIYQDVDEAILKYLEDHQYFSLKTTAVEFSNKNGVYARIYVNDISIYEKALQQYLSYFINPEELALLNNGQKTPELKTYGSRSTGLSILQSITTS